MAKGMGCRVVVLACWVRLVAKRMWRKRCIDTGISGEHRAVDAGLAMTPPMGWNSWNKFACNVDENADPADGGRAGLKAG